jgi:hypothetical protein
VLVHPAVTVCLCGARNVIVNLRRRLELPVGSSVPTTCERSTGCWTGRSRPADVARRVALSCMRTPTWSCLRRRAGQRLDHVCSKLPMRTRQLASWAGTPLRPGDLWHSVPRRSTRSALSEPQSWNCFSPGRGAALHFGAGAHSSRLTCEGKTTSRRAALPATNNLSSLWRQRGVLTTSCVAATRRLVY